MIFHTAITFAQGGKVILHACGHSDAAALGTRPAQLPAEQFTETLGKRDS